MFYYPNRIRAIRVQQTLQTLYEGAGGIYCYGDDAWKYVRRRTGVDLKRILTTIAANNILSRMVCELLSRNGNDRLMDLLEHYDRFVEKLGGLANDVDVDVVRHEFPDEFPDVESLKRAIAGIIE